LEIDNEKIYSAGNDNKIKIWDIKTGKLLNTLSFHKKAIVDLGIEEDKLISFSDDLSIKIFNTKENKILQSIYTKNFESGNLTFHNNKLIYSENKESYGIWDIKTGKLENKLDFEISNKFISNKYFSSFNKKKFTEIELSNAQSENPQIIMSDSKRFPNKTNNNSYHQVINYQERTHLPHEHFSNIGGTAGVTDNTPANYYENLPNISGYWGINKVHINNLKSLNHSIDELIYIEEKNGILIGLTENNKLIKWEIGNGKIIFEKQFDETIYDLNIYENNIFIALKNKIIYIPINGSKMKTIYQNEDFTFYRIKISENKLLSTDLSKKENNFLLFDLEKNELTKVFTIQYDKSDIYLETFSNFYNNKILLNKGLSIITYQDIFSSNKKTLGFNFRIFEFSYFRSKDSKIFFLYRSLTEKGYNEKYEVNVIDFENEKLINNLSDYNLGTIYNFEVRDNKLYNFFSDEEIVKVWEFDKNLVPVLLNTFNFKLNGMRTYLYGTDKNKFIVTLYNEKDEKIGISLWDVNTGEIIKKYTSEQTISELITRKDKIILTLKDNSLIVLNSDTLEIIQKIENDLPIERFFTNDEFIILIGKGNVLKTWALKDYKLIIDKKPEKIDSAYIPNIIFNAEESTLNYKLQTDNKFSFYKWDIKNGNLIKFYSNKDEYSKDYPFEYEIDNFGVQNNKNNFKIVNLKTNEEFKLKTESEEEYVVLILNDLILTSKSFYGISYIYSLSKNKLLVRFL
jgi:hypothetical protein